MICNYNAETNFPSDSEMTLPKKKKNLKTFGERAVVAEDTLCMTSGVTNLRQLSFEVKDYEMFTYKSSVQEQDGRGHV